MAITVIHYTVRPEAAADNQALVAAVFEQLALARPAGFQYAVVKLADGVTFAHVITGDRAEAGEALRQLSAFQAFTRDGRQRWVEGTAPGEATVIGEFGR